MAENWTKDRKDNSAETEIMASKAPTSLLFFTFYEETAANLLQSTNDLFSFDNGGFHMYHFELAFINQLYSIMTRLVRLS